MSFGVEPSSFVKSTIIIVVLLSILFIVAGIIISKKDPRKMPKGILFLLISVVDFINKHSKNYFSERWRFFAPYLFAVCAFLGLANTISLFGLTPPLGNVFLALTLSIITFFMIQISAIKCQGIRDRLIGFFGPVKWLTPLFLPMNIISEFTTPLSMGLRLFGNIMSGVAIAAIITFTFGWLSILPTALIIHPIFDLAFGLLQMYVFFMLSTMFLTQVANTD